MEQVQGVRTPKNAQRCADAEDDLFDYISEKDLDCDMSELAEKVTAWISTAILSDVPISSPTTLCAKYPSATPTLYTRAALELWNGVMRGEDLGAVSDHVRRVARVQYGVLL